MTTSADLTEAWHAVAPPPPPGTSRPPSRSDVRPPPSPRVGDIAHLPNATPTPNAASPRPHSPSPGAKPPPSSRIFDVHASGGFLPPDSHSPEPERPVSRNAMQRQRTKSRDAALFASQQAQQQQQPPPPPPSQRSGRHDSFSAAPPTSWSPQAGGPSSYARSRYDSSPAIAYASPSAQQHATYAAQPMQAAPPPPQPQQHQQHPQSLYHSQAAQQHPGYPPHPPPSGYVTYAAPVQSTPQPLAYPAPNQATPVYPHVAQPPHVPFSVAGVPAQPTGPHGHYAWPAAPAPTAPPGTLVHSPAGWQAAAANPPPHGVAPNAYATYPAAYPPPGPATQAAYPVAAAAPPPPQQYMPATYAPPHVMPPPSTHAAVSPAVAVGPPMPPPSAASPAPATYQAAPATYQALPGQAAVSARPLPEPSGRPGTFANAPTTAASRSDSLASASSASSFDGGRAQSLRSTTGSVRRALPQPPAGPSPATQPSTSPATVTRAESIKMAAEALMAKGPPRRGTLPRFSVATNNPATTTVGNGTGAATPSSPSKAESSPMIAARSRMGGADTPTRAQTMPSVPGAAAAAAAEAAAAPGVASGGRSEAKSVGPQDVDGLANAMGRVKVSSHAAHDRNAEPMQHVDAPPSPPRRPSSRGPRDDVQAGRERRDSRTNYALHGPVHVGGGQDGKETIAPPSTIPVIHSPPPDTTPPMPIISFGDETAPTVGPAISVSVAEPEADEAAPKGMPPTREGQDGRAAQARPQPPASTGAAVPSISVVGDGEPDEEGEEDAGGPQARITISHSGNLANPQRAQGVDDETTSGGGGSVRRSPGMAAGAAEPGAASAPRLGAGTACGGCGKFVAGGRVISAMSRRFHPACFRCSHCDEALEHVAFYEREGKAYCHFDYHELFSKRCFHCRTPIVDERFITISDPELVGHGGGSGRGGENGADDAAAEGGAPPRERCYHDLHFFCANCGDPFLDPKAAGSAAGSNPDALLCVDEQGRVSDGAARQFVVWKGYPYCEKCHNNLHKPRCKGCKRPILDGDVVTALRGKWHPECFVCERCKKPFEVPSFFTRNGRAYDEECFKVLLRNEL